jgi:ornithine cyclodeaminase
VLPFERILVWARNSGAAARLAKLFPDEACVEPADSLPEACAEADVICTVTAAAEPVLAGAWLKAGTHLCLVGSSFPDRREVDDECVARGRYFVDYRGSAMAQAGELLHAIKSGRVSEAHVVAEIGAVLAGTVPGRRDPEEITIYKSLGVAAQDLAAGMALFRRAVLRDVGVIATL